MAPREISANRLSPPKKESRLQSMRCVHHAASSQTYCQPNRKEGLKKSRATTWKAFWAAGNRRFGACADSRVHCPLEASRNSTFIPPNVVHAGTLAGLLRFRRRGFRCALRRLGARRSFRGLLFIRRPHSLEFHACNTPAVHFDNGKSKLTVLKTFSPARNKAQLRQDESANGRVRWIFGQRNVVLRIQIAHVKGGVENHRTIG